ncbi:MAG: zf-HC2 domain-containing protein [Chloroflexi bacterium]|nr:zf-HC2 domain-containing protein [Chloroflexota bacterium]
MEIVVGDSASWIDRLIGRDQKHSPDDPCADGMGDCGQVRVNASDFIDGEAPSRLTTRIRHHLGLCTDCNGWVTTLAQTVGLLRQTRQHEVPDSLRNRISRIADD